MNISDEFDYEKLGEAIRLFRKQKELKQSYVAKKAGISQPHYCKMEQGTRHLSLDQFLAVCDVLEVSPLLLFYFAGFRKTYNIGNISASRILKGVLSHLPNETGKIAHFNRGGVTLN
ncbi:MAG: helix-turn-helix domain-containing protein [Bacteroidia bacterium]|nr:helix-turn-helix domain-containing protein [Bacteroidia bacterium]